MHETLPVEPSPPASPSLQNFSFFDSNNCLDTSKLTPHQMSLNASNMQPTVDPALLPIKSNEIRPLVRLLHLISEAINDRVSFTSNFVAVAFGTNFLNPPFSMAGE